MLQIINSANHNFIDILSNHRLELDINRDGFFGLEHSTHRFKRVFQTLDSILHPVKGRRNISPIDKHHFLFVVFVNLIFLAQIELIEIQVIPIEAHIHFLYFSIDFQGMSVFSIIQLKLQKSVIDLDILAVKVDWDLFLLSRAQWDIHRTKSLIGEQINLIFAFRLAAHIQNVFCVAAMHQTSDIRDVFNGDRGGLVGKVANDAKIDLRVMNEHFWTLKVGDHLEGFVLVGVEMDQEIQLFILVNFRRRKLNFEFNFLLS